MLIIPKLSEIYEDILADFQGKFGVVFPAFGKNFLKVFASVQAAKINLMYRFLGFIQKNIFADTADPEADGGTLERFGRVKLNRGIRPGTESKYNVTVTGVAGAIVPNSSVLKSDADTLNPDNLYITDQDYVFITDQLVISIRSLEVGASQILLPGDHLNFTVPLLNVNPEAQVLIEVLRGLNAETMEEYRSDILNSFRLEAQGGSAADYVLWSIDVQGVAKAYPYAKTNAPNEVEVFIEAKLDDSTDGFGTPAMSMLTAVESAIRLNPDTSLPNYERGRLPLGIFFLHVLAVNPLPVIITITQFSLPDSTSLRNTILNLLKVFLSKIRPYIASIDIVQNNILSKFNVISLLKKNYPPENFNDIIITVSGNIHDNYTFNRNFIPYIETVIITN